MSEYKLTKDNCKIRVSSVLNNEQNMFGAKNMIDESYETCWNSDSLGLKPHLKPHFIRVEFDSKEFHFKGRSHSIKGLQLMFQGNLRARLIERWVLF